MIHHPCGALPVSGLSLSAWYCHHHQAWFARADAYEQREGDITRTLHSHSVDFGPFDTEEDVRSYLVTHLDVGLACARLVVNITPPESED